MKTKFYANILDTATQVDNQSLVQLVYWGGNYNNLSVSNDTIPPNTRWVIVEIPDDEITACMHGMGNGCGIPYVYPIYFDMVK